MDRRGFLSVAAVAGLAPGLSAVASAQQAAAPARAEPPLPPKLVAALAASRMPVDFNGSGFSGAGFDWLVARGAAAEVFMLGEEHGIAENAKLAATLFTRLVPHGYRRLAIEISPPMATALDRHLSRGGYPALKALLTTPESRVAFFGMAQEAQLLAAARAVVPAREPLLWGLDYEIGADRYLIAELQQRRKPAAAAAALAALDTASRDAWKRYDATHNLQHVFSFSGDPALVEAVERAWPGADADSKWMLETLRETAAINAEWVKGSGYQSNLRRSRFLRANLLRHWREEQRRGRPARLFMKFGGSHVVRGLSMTDVFDIGSLVPELAEARGGRSFHLLVLAGKGRPTANLNPETFRYEPGDRNQYGAGSDPFHGAALPGTFTLFDTAPLRAVTRSSNRDLHPETVRAIHGFDAVLAMTGSTPSTNL